MAEVRLVMTLSREEFLRLLPGAAGPFVEGEDGSLVGEQGWRIGLTPVPELRLGALVLQRFQVALTLPPGTPAQAEAFLHRFHTRFRKGGG